MGSPFSRGCPFYYFLNRFIPRAARKGKAAAAQETRARKARKPNSENHRVLFSRPKPPRLLHGRKYSPHGLPKYRTSQSRSRSPPHRRVEPPPAPPRTLL